MSKKSNKKPVKMSQEELRKLMKQKTQTERIQSPYAKYNSLDQLSCSVCGKVIKSKQLWQAHVLSKPHKEMVEKMKVQGPTHKLSHITELTAKKTKHRSPSPSEPPVKVIKSILKNSNNKHQPPPSTTPSTTPLLKNLNEKNASNSGNDKQIINDKTIKSDNDRPMIEESRTDISVEAVVGEVKDEKEDGKAPPHSTSNIPEGFFDDPKLDAKARNVKYVDRMEEEMELFQKEIKQTEQENQVLVEEEDELTSEQRSLDQLDEEINLWSKPFSLAKNKEEKLQKVVEKVEVKEEKDSDEEDVDLTPLLDWRSKMPFKK